MLTGREMLFPAVILAGGRSQRMGTDKAFITLGGHSLLQHSIDRLAPQVASIAINAPSLVPAFQQYDHVPDTLEGFRGPLAGILAAMRFAATLPENPHHVLTTAVDTPFIPANLAKRLSAACDTPQTIAIASSSGAMHPVCGLWPVSLADDLQAFLETPEKARVKTFLSRHRCVEVDFAPVATPSGDLDPFFNVNRPDDLQEAERYLEAHA